MMNDLDKIFSLKNRIIVITGAIGLLGRKHAEAIAAYGGTPILLDINPSELIKFESELNEKYNTNSISYVVDITNENQVEQNARDIVDSAQDVRA